MGRPRAGDTVEVRAGGGWQAVPVVTAGPKGFQAYDKPGDSAGIWWFEDEGRDWRWPP